MRVEREEDVREAKAKHAPATWQAPVACAKLAQKPRANCLAQTVYCHRLVASRTPPATCQKSPNRGLTPPSHGPREKRTMREPPYTSLILTYIRAHRPRAAIDAASPLQRAERRSPAHAPSNQLSNDALAYRHRECRNRPQWSCCEFSSPIPWSHPKTRCWRQTICKRTRFTRATNDCPRANC